VEAADRPNKRRTLVHWLPVMVVAALVIGFGVFTGLAWWITAGAYERGAAAMQQFPGDEVDALSALVQSEKHSLSLSAGAEEGDRPV
jgi:hypothetical protein